jgi:hypothetical protein
MPPLPVGPLFTDRPSAVAVSGMTSNIAVDLFSVSGAHQRH